MPLERINRTICSIFSDSRRNLGKEQVRFIKKEYSRFF